MVMQNGEGMPIDTPSCLPLRFCGERSYTVAVPAHLLDEQGTLLDQLIGLAFDTHNGLYLEVRVYDAKQ